MRSYCKGLHMRITHMESYPERPSKKCRSGFPPKMSLHKKDATSSTCVVSGNLSFSWLFLPKLIFNNHFRFCDALHGKISPTTTWDVKNPVNNGTTMDKLSIPSFSICADPLTRHGANSLRLSLSFLPRCIILALVSLGKSERKKWSIIVYKYLSSHNLGNGKWMKMSPSNIVSFHLG